MNEIIPPTLLVLILVLWSIIFCRYFYRQNKSSKMGGRISAPKAFWLAYASFYYFVFSLWVLFFFTGSRGERNTLLVFIITIFIRLILQLIIMFRYHAWRPSIGISFNLIMVLILTWMLINQGAKVSGLYTLYLAGAIFILITDSIYAYLFHRATGHLTTGKMAIWFASKESKYSGINRLTRLGNLAHLGFFIYIGTCTFTQFH